MNNCPNKCFHVLFFHSFVLFVCFLNKRKSLDFKFTNDLCSVISVTKKKHFKESIIGQQQYSFCSLFSDHVIYLRMVIKLQSFFFKKFDHEYRGEKSFNHIDHFLHKDKIHYQKENEKVYCLYR